MPTRDEAFQLLCEFNKTEKMLKHALAVEAVMRFFARKRGADENLWGIIGLIHDLDFEMFPSQHCTKTREILEQRGWPADWVRAAISHGWGMCTDIEPQTELERVLFTIDELTGLVAATALVRPSKSIFEVEVKSVKKKWKEKSFAAGVSRETIERGAEMLGLPLDGIIADTITGMREAADALGLRGTASH